MIHGTNVILPHERHQILLPGRIIGSMLSSLNDLCFEHLRIKGYLHAISARIKT